MKSTEYYKSGRLIENAKNGCKKGHIVQAQQTEERTKLYSLNPSKCEHCNLDLAYQQRKYKFCSRSCAASYNNKLTKRKYDPIYNCLQCRIGCISSHRKNNKFCSTACSGRYRWLNDTIPRIESGKCEFGSTLKKYLSEKNGEICAICSQVSIHNNLPLVLQLDHIDGNSDNNFPINLRLLCPNCHTQTETYSAKGQGNKFRKQSKRNKDMRVRRGYKE